MRLRSAPSPVIPAHGLVDALGEQALHGVEGAVDGGVDGFAVLLGEAAQHPVGHVVVRVGLGAHADLEPDVYKRQEGTILAHTDGGVPEVLIEVDDLSAYNVGYLIYFFWRACACSGYLLSVNPFNQPGVESYKKNMFALLGKPGYEGLTAELEAKLK